MAGVVEVMIPILYEKTEKEYMTNGIGRLSDALTCVVSEERNGQYELEMTYPVTGIHYEYIIEDNIILAAPAEDVRPQPFRIYSVSREMGGIVTVNAQHISYDLKKMVVLPIRAGSAADAMTAIKGRIIGECPFSFWTEKKATGTLDQAVPIECRALLGGVEGSVLDCFGGGEYEFDRFEVKLHENRGTDNNVTISYGKNMTGMDADVDYSSAYTAMVPYWQSEDTVVIGDRVESGHTADFATQRCVTMDFSAEFEDTPTKEQLQARASQYMRANETWMPSVSVNVSFLPLWQTQEYMSIAPLERVHLCDYVTVIHKELGLTIREKVVKTEYNVLLEMYESMTLGSVRESFAEAATKHTASKAEVQKTQRELSDYKTNTDSYKEATSQALADEVTRATSREVELGSQITQTEQRMSDKVDSAESGLRSEIAQTAETITSTVEDKEQKIYSQIEQTASSITATVENVEEGLRSEITQTATSITAVVEDKEQKIYSQIEQTASSITATVENVEKGLRSEIVQTAESITSTVENKEQKIYSRIEQTASSITSRVEDVEKGLMSEITQTESSIQASITDTEKGLQTQITQNEKSITQIVKQVSKDEEKMSMIEQKADKIDFLVKSGTSSSNFTITDKLIDLVSKGINITGYVTFNDLSTSGKTTINGGNISTGTIDASKVTVVNLNASNITSGTIDVSRVYASGNQAIGMGAYGMILGIGGQSVVIGNGGGIGFFGHVPSRQKAVTRPTSATMTLSSLQSLITALREYGLIA